MLDATGCSALICCPYLSFLLPTTLGRLNKHIATSSRAQTGLCFVIQGPIPVSGPSLPAQLTTSRLLHPPLPFCTGQHHGPAGAAPGQTYLIAASWAALSMLSFPTFMLTKLDVKDQNSRPCRSHVAWAAEQSVCGTLVSLYFWTFVHYELRPSRVCPTLASTAYIAGKAAIPC